MNNLKKLTRKQLVEKIKLQKKIIEDILKKEEKKQRELKLKLFGPFYVFLENIFLENTLDDLKRQEKLEKRRQIERILEGQERLERQLHILFL